MRIDVTLTGKAAESALGAAPEPDPPVPTRRSLEPSSPSRPPAHGTRRTPGWERETDTGDLARVEPLGTDEIDVAIVAGRSVRVDPGLFGAAPDHGAIPPMPIRSGALLPRPVAPPSGGLEVRVVAGPGTGLRASLGDRAVSIGRDVSNTLAIDDPAMSRRHAVFDIRTHQVRVRDVGSTNATSLDGTVVSEAVVGSGQLVSVGTCLVSVARANQAPASVHWQPDGTGVVNRPPPVPRSPEPDPIPAVREPATTGLGRVAWLAALLPAVAGIGLAWWLHNLQFLLFALVSPLMMLGNAAGDRLSLRRERRNARRAHHADQKAQERLISGRLADEADARRRELPDATTVADIVSLPASRLWEARAEHGLVVRAGVADQPARQRTQLPDSPTDTTPAGIIPAAPIPLDLADTNLGVCGPAERTRGAARWLICQLAARYSPVDLEFAVVVDEPSERFWHWMRWLPHLGQRIATNSEETAAFAADVAAEVGRADAGDGSGRRRRRRRVVLIDADRLTPGLAALGAALRRGPAAGVTAIWIGADAADLPPACTTALQVSGHTGWHCTITGSASLEPAGYGGAPPTPTPGKTPTAPGTGLLDAVGVGYADRLARALAPLVDAEDNSSAGAFGPARLTELAGVADLDPSGVCDRWRRADARARTVLGTGDGKLIAVDLVDDGPHALVAGTTGAGKSELLQSLVAGLAANYPPQQLGFVLIDYKGGAAFGECARLPHVTGLVTDLDHHLTGRALRSLNAELTRRERLFAAVGASDLVTFRARNPGCELARLVIVVDEFATLAEELPDFVTGLVGVAQRGRSLGVHLVLATQRPGGVVSAEIRANTSLRIALRVTDAEESHDVIGTADAARLTRHQPGRGFIARDSTLTEVQVARVTRPVRTNSGDQMRVLRLDRWRRLPQPGPADAGDKTDLALLCDTLTEAWRLDGAAEPVRPWLPPLPLRVTPRALPEVDPGRVAIGIVDLPDEQRTAAYTLDLAAGGTLLLAGGSRSGRSSGLLRIALAAAMQRDPVVEIYAVAPSGGPLTRLRRLPQCGTVAVDAPTAKALLTALSRRLSDAPDGTHPRRLLLIDDYESFHAASDDHDLGASAEHLQELLRGAARSSLTVVLAGGRGVLVPRLTGAVGQRLVLPMPDPADYAAAGIAAADTPADPPPGHAVRAGDGAAVALAMPTEPDRSLADAIAGAAAGVAELRNGQRGALAHLIRFRPLPGQVALADLAPGRPNQFVLGLAGPAAEPLTINPWTGARRLLVTGPSRSGRSTTICSLARQAIAGPSGQTPAGVAGVAVVLAGPPRSPLAELAAEHGLPLITPRSEDPPDIDQQRPVLLLVDDSEEFTDTAVGDALVELIKNSPELAVIAAARTDDLMVSFRGIGPLVRRGRAVLVLQPGAADAELLGARLGRVAPTTIAGRGMITGDPAWGAGEPARPIQVAW